MMTFSSGSLGAEEMLIYIFMERLFGLPVYLSFLPV